MSITFFIVKLKRAFFLVFFGFWEIFFILGAQMPSWLDKMNYFAQEIATFLNFTWIQYVLSIRGKIARLSKIKNAGWESPALFRLVLR